jgi:hypothetical protein
MFWIDGWWRASWAAARAKAEAIGATRISRSYGHPDRGEDPTTDLALYAVLTADGWKQTKYLEAM